jgi:peptidoglycan-associated lipoprotein
MTKTRVALLALLAFVLALAVGCGSARKTTRNTDAGAQTDQTSGDQGDTTTPPIEEPDRVSTYELNPVHFDFDRADIRAGDREILTRHGEYLTDNPSVRVTIEGHCDERGTVEYNLALGERRARAARDFLESYGVSGSRMETISYGKERPADPGHDESAWARNRRAEFVRR